MPSGSSQNVPIEDRVDPVGEAAPLPDTHSGFLSDETLETYEAWLDSKFRLPGTSMHFGLDGLIGLIPGIGDLTTTGISTVFVADAIKSGARLSTLLRMVGNIGLDFVLGAIPFVGDLFDFAFKSNTKNLRILKEEREHLRERAKRLNENRGSLE